VTAHYAGRPGEFFRFRISGWIVSLCLHGSIILLSGLLIAKIGLISPSSPFRWDVTIVGPQSSSSVPTPHEASSALPKEPSPSARRTPSYGPNERRSVAPPPAAPIMPAPPEAIDSLTAVSDANSLYSEPPRTSENTTATPLQEDPRSHGQTLPPRAAMTVETSTPSHSSLPVAVALDTHASPANDPSSPVAAPAITQQAAATPPQVASHPPSTSPVPAPQRPDYRWLADPLARRIEELKQYPASARLNHLEGRVVVRIVIEEDGRITSAAIAKSSGHEVLDQAALDTLRQVSPITLSRPLEKSQLAIQVPLSYRLSE
jgi:protein TonB